MTIEQNIQLTVDAVVFGYDNIEGLSILLIRRKNNPFKGNLALPGGFVKNHESLENAVKRELKEETGISPNYFEQLFTFGNTNRDSRGRIVTVAYFALIKKSKFNKLKSSTDAEDAQWVEFEHIPKLSFDHNSIVQLAIERLRAKVRYSPIGFELLDKKFPFSDLEKLYSTILNREIDRRNFKKKIMSLGVLDELDERLEVKKSGRPPRLFQFNSKVYSELLKKGGDFEV